MTRERKNRTTLKMMLITCNFNVLNLEEEKLPVRRSHIGNEAYLDQMVIANSLHTEVNDTTQCLIYLDYSF